MNFGRVGTPDAEKIIDDRRGTVSDEVRFRSSGLLLAHRVTAFRGNPEDICSDRVLLTLTRNRP
jgi:hypothetical protein